MMLLTENAKNVRPMVHVEAVGVTPDHKHVVVLCLFEGQQDQATPVALPIERDAAMVLLDRLQRWKDRLGWTTPAPAPERNQ